MVTPTCPSPELPTVVGTTGLVVAGVVGAGGGGAVVVRGTVGHGPLHPVGVSNTGVAGPGLTPIGVVPGPLTCGGTNGLTLTSLDGSLGFSVVGGTVGGTVGVGGTVVPGGSVVAGGGTVVPEGSVVAVGGTE